MLCLPPTASKLVFPLSPHFIPCCHRGKGNYFLHSLFPAANDDMHKFATVSAPVTQTAERDSRFPQTTLRPLLTAISCFFVVAGRADVRPSGRAVPVDGAAQALHRLSIRAPAHRGHPAANGEVNNNNEYNNEAFFRRRQRPRPNRIFIVGALQFLGTRN